MTPESFCCRFLHFPVIYLPAVSVSKPWLLCTINTFNITAKQSLARTNAVHCRWHRLFFLYFLHQMSYCCSNLTSCYLLLIILASWFDRPLVGPPLSSAVQKRQLGCLTRLDKARRDKGGGENTIRRVLESWALLSYRRSWWSVKCFSTNVWKIA